VRKQNTKNKIEINYNLGRIEIENEYFVSFFSGDSIVTKNSKKAHKGMKTEQWRFPYMTYQLIIAYLM